MSNSPQMARIHRWTLGDRLRAARIATTASQTEFADAVGISRRTITALESDQARPKPIYLREWARVTGFDLEWLMTGTEPTVSPDGDIIPIKRARRHQPTTDRYPTHTSPHRIAA